MTPITGSELSVEPTIQKAQSHQEAIAAQNGTKSLDLHEYLKSLPNPHAKPKTPSTTPVK